MVAGSAVAVNEGWLPWRSEGRLHVRVESLPDGKIGDVTVRGPEGLTKHLTRTSTLTGVKPGQYVVEAGGLRGTDHDLFPPKVEQTVTVTAGGTASATVDYNTVVPHTTKSVSARDIHSVDGASVTLSSESATANALAPGDVLVAGVGRHTPEGLLRKVTEVRRNGRGVTAVTKPATLREAVPQGRINVVDEPVMSPEEAMRQEDPAPDAAFAGPGITPAGLRKGSAATGEDPELEADGEGGFTFLYEIRKGETSFGADPDDPKRGEASLECTAGGSLPFLGNAAFTATTPKMTLDTSWGQGTQKGVRWLLTASQTSSLGAKTNAVEAKCDGRWLYPKAPIRIGVIVIPLGPLPVVIGVHAALTGALSVGGKVAVKAGQNAHFEAGIEVPDNGGAKGIAEFDNQFVLHEPPSFEIEGSFKVGARLSFQLYGTVGPYLDITPGLKLVHKTNFERQATIKTELRGGLYTTAGIDLEWLGFDKGSVEISDLYHVDRVLWDETWHESPAGRAARENPTACPDAATMTAAVADLDEVTDPVDMRVTGRKCWRDWAVADWVPGLSAERVSATLFKRKGDSLTPALTMVGGEGPAGGKAHTATCTEVKDLEVPSGLLDYLCPAGTGASATAAFDPASADVFASGGDGYVPVRTDAELKKLRGPLRAVQACGNCSPKGGDGSAQIIMLFYGNRYVGMVKRGAAFSSRQVAAQNGTRVISRVQWATPEDPVCCPSGPVAIYQYTWRDHELRYTESVSSG
ncbi:LppP/LprE family lipoprotein [[Kitasatospora] papulosa]|uniref:LppP/LprE family lipoprotein n=1 Tax=[Kitasatospora] papulosa TaxID=1464011 RepID=UPI0036BF96A8